MRRDTFVLSPLFSNTHQNNFFKGSFTPTNFTPRQPLDTHRSIGINFDDFAFRMPENPEVYNKQLDNIVDNLKNEIQTKTETLEHKSGNKELDLDISLIDDTYTPAPLTKSSAVFKFPVSQPGTNRSQGQSFKLLQSPNSSFLMRKKY